MPALSLDLIMSHIQPRTRIELTSFLINENNWSVTYKQARIYVKQVSYFCALGQT
jgi:hypothetical protein